MFYGSKNDGLENMDSFFLGGEDLGSQKLMAKNLQISCKGKNFEGGKNLERQEQFVQYFDKRIILRARKAKLGG